MSAKFTPETLVDATVVDDSGATIGRVGGVFLGDSSGEPTWVSVTTGLLGTTTSLIPLVGATIAGGTITVPFAKSRLRDAPHHDSTGRLSEADESALRRHYGIPDGAAGLRNDDPTSDNDATHHHGRTYSGNATNVKPPAGGTSEA